jgi:ribosomal protein S21
MPHLAENPRTARKAAIKRASAVARRDMNKLDADTLAEVGRIYRQAVSDLQGAVNGYAGSDGTVRLEVLQDLLAQAQARLAQLEQMRNQLLNTGLDQATELGIGPFRAESAVLKGSLSQIADETVRFVTHFVGEDGLQLSDRLWRIDNNARRVVADAIQSAVIQGHSASRAAQDFLSRGLAVPKDVADKLTAAGAQGIGKNIADSILKAEGNPYDAALRVFRTELNRAHGEAYQAAAFAHPDVIGTRFLLSPNHPRHDICDLHAHANVHGLGPGVYPKGKNPWPAHPNTLSYVEVVFDDEVTEADKSGKESRLEWLEKQPFDVQASVLGAEKKAQAFRAGILRENEIATPWRVLKQKYERRGIDTDRLAEEQSRMKETELPEAYRIAEAGGKHAGLLKRYRNDPDHLIERAIRTYNKRIEEHRAWIVDPMLKVSDDLTDIEIDYLIGRKWPDDIRRLEQERDIMTGILEERKRGK